MRTFHMSAVLDCGGLIGFEMTAARTFVATKGSKR